MRKIILLSLICILAGYYILVNPLFTQAAFFEPAVKYEQVPGEVLVKLKGRDKVYRLSDQRGVDTKYLLEHYQDNELIEYAEPNYTYQAALIPDDPDYIQQYYLREIEAPSGWDITTGSNEVVVAVLDSGVDTFHPDLRDNLWVNTGEKPYDRVDNDGNGLVDDFYGWNFVDNNNDINPVFENFTGLGVNHGTIVSGVIAARGNNHLGITGAAWNVKLMNLKVLDSTGVGDTVSVTKAIDYAIQKGAHVINLSLVGSQSSQTLLAALRRAWDAGLVIVAATGNEVGVGDNMNVVPAYPVCNDDVDNIIIGVVAVDRDRRKADFSNYGSTCSDVSAPGVNFFSTSVYNEVYPGFNHYYRGGNSGTSVAAPLVTALAALIKSVSPTLTNVQIRNIILNTTTDIDNLNPDYKGQLGTGLVNYARALGAAQGVKSGITNPVSQDWIVTAAGAGGGPHVRVFDYQQNVLSQFFAYANSFRGGVNVASGDVDGDGQEEIITAAGAGGGPHIRVFDSKGNLEYQFFAYDKDFRGGVNLAVGDVDEDGLDEIITVPESLSASVVKIFDYSGHMQFKFLAYADNFQGGASVAVGDVDGDSEEEIITGPGAGGGPHIRVFTRSGKIKSEFFAYDKDFRGGVHVTVADVDHNGTEEIITGPGAGGGPHVRMFNQAGKLIKQFFAFDPDLRSGTYVAAGDVTGDGVNELIVAPATGAAPEVRIFSTDAKLLSSFFAYNPGFLGGVRLNVIAR